MFDVFVDSGANIPAELVDKYGITVMPLHLTVDGKSVMSFEPHLTLQQERDKGHEFYQAMREGAKVKTSLVNSEDFSKAFTVSLKQGHDILLFTMSKNISGTYNAARLAAEDLLEQYPERKIRIVDALNASLGEGILAIYAVEMQQKGKDLDQTADYLESIVGKMNGVFTVDDLSYLASTGRLSNMTAFVGNFLGIKPLLKGNKDGYIVSFEKPRGRRKALDRLITLMVNNITDPENQIVGIAHADAYEDSLYVVNKVLEKVKVREFINTTYDFGTGSHVGPETIAVFFIADDRELLK